MSKKYALQSLSEHFDRANYRTNAYVEILLLDWIGIRRDFAMFFDVIVFVSDTCCTSCSYTRYPRQLNAYKVLHAKAL